MGIIASSETIDPTCLGKGEKRCFIRELYEVQCKIFQGVDIKSFTNYIFRPDAVRTRVKIFRNEKRQAVGYHSVHLFEKKSGGGRIMAIFRAEAGLLRNYRRKHSTLSLAITEFCPYRFLHPLRKMYYLGTLVHPSSYHLIFRHVKEMYPTYRHETPSEIIRSMCEIAKDLGIGDPVCQDNPLIVQVGWSVRNNIDDLEYWHHCDKPDVNYFMKMNPGYGKGEGLLTLVPITYNNLIWLLIRWSIEIGRRFIFRRRRND